MVKRIFNRFLVYSLLLVVLTLPSSYVVQALDFNQNINVQVLAKKEVTVYVTNTGSKYHRSNCRYLKQSKIPMKLSVAKKSYDPCKVCKPPK